jgi:futalosine hydrolase
MVVAATELELQCTLDIKHLASITLMKELHGIGQVPTTYHVTQLIDKHQPDIMIQIGIGGGFAFDQILGEAVAVETEYFADLGVEEKGKFHSIFDMKLADQNAFPFNEKKLSNPHRNLLEKVKLKTVSAITVNQITTSKNQIEYYQEAYCPFIESMEGAAFHYCCLMKKIPFLQIRAVSNHVGERDKSKWEIEKSIQSLKNSLNIFLKNI